MMGKLNGNGMVNGPCMENPQSGSYVHCRSAQRSFLGQMKLEVENVGYCVCDERKTRGPQ